MKREVVVLGGGAAGAAAALTLARRGRRVVLAERGAGVAPRVGEALPPAARPLLSELGILALVQEGGHRQCLGNVSIWGSPVPAVHDFVFDPQGCGWHLDRRRFDEDLRGAAAAAGAEVATGTGAVGVESTDSGWRVKLREAAGGLTEVHCRWLIDATGRGSAIARRLGARRRQEDHLIAFVARFGPAAGAPDPDSRTWIEAVPGGWWYTAPVPSGERVVAFHTDADLADRSGLRRPGGFAALLARAGNIHGLLTAQGYRIDGDPRGVDASTARLERAAGSGWLAVGDASVSLDPLSSQGLFNALYTGLKGAEAADGALGGDGLAPNAYQARVDRIYRAYLKHRTTFYTAESRWPARPFWARRTAC